ncbi:hypothetical protein [Arthrobacter sp. fls2-241-R2A-172]|uniref:hypothetical protein n=1 Tax=Arthrobacter sp. fls2-241-R2A-172 TaxID=3040325 RepID=UPI00254EE57E|nr:hypothetical protein [Arthrobacter sp. fls2-241-R2A-172]
MTARKTPAKATESKAPEPGPKPRSFVVENTLKCQTAADGEISLSVLLPYAKMKQLLTIEDQELPEMEMVDYVLDEIMPAADSATLKGLQDGADTILFTMEWLQAVGERLGGQQGKFGPSSN